VVGDEREVVALIDQPILAILGDTGFSPPETRLAVLQNARASRQYLKSNDPTFDGAQDDTFWGSGEIFPLRLAESHSG
jgi:hypothetical protein